MYDIWASGDSSEVYKGQGPESRELLAGCWLTLLGFVKQSCAEQKEEIRHPDGEDQTCPKELNASSQQEAV